MTRPIVLCGFVWLAMVLPAQAQQRDPYVMPTPYATTTQELAKQREKAAAQWAEKNAQEKAKRAACTREAKAQKLGLMKRRAFVRDCVKR